jgi:hypothetical protein
MMAVNLVLNAYKILVGKLKKETTGGSRHEWEDRKRS